MNLEPFNPGFSTADAQYPSLELRAGELHLRFIDWREQPIHAVFDDVVAFQWGEAQGATELRNDESYVVTNSPWLNQYQREELATAAHRHFKLCFNEVGVLEVLALGVSVKS